MALPNQGSEILRWVSVHDRLPKEEKIYSIKLNNERWGALYKDGRFYLHDHILDYYPIDQTTDTFWLEEIPIENIDHPLHKLLVLVSESTHVPISEIFLSGKKGRGKSHVAFARQLYCWLGRKYFHPEYSMTTIASRIGYDHQLLLYSAVRINEELEMGIEPTTENVYRVEKEFIESGDAAFIKSKASLAGFPMPSLKGYYTKNKPAHKKSTCKS